MEYRPCIDIHNGKVKQLVGASLHESNDSAKENFVSEKDADFFASFFREQELWGGHVVMLNSLSSPYYEATKAQALKALAAYPGGFQVGGGIRTDNAEEFLNAGASHVIVTSYVFHDGIVDMERLKQLVAVCGKERLVIDLSCKKSGGDYYVVTDRWTKLTENVVDRELMARLSSYCSEYLIHAADVEGKTGGVDEELIARLAEWDGIPITYAGGVSTYDDILTVKEIGRGRINLTIGSALDIYGGSLNYETVLDYFRDV